MLTEKKIEEVLEALSDAGLCVCNTSMIEQHHPGLITDTKYLLGRMEEGGERTRISKVLLAKHTE